MANQAEVDLVVNAAGALPDLEQQLSRIVRTAEDGAPEIDVQASIAVQHSIAVMSTDLDRAIRAVDETNPTIDVSAAMDIQESLRNLSNDAEQLTRLAQSGLFDPIELQAELDFAGSLAELTADLRHLTQDAERTAEVIRIEAELHEERVERMRQRLRRLGQEVRGFATSSGRALGTFGAGVSGLIVAGGSLVNTLAAVAAAVQQVAPAAAVATSGLLTLKLATGTVQLAMIGVEDAIEKAFDPDAKPEDLAKDLERLAPEARKFVVELQGMRKELTAVQQGVQNRFFRNLDDDLRSLSKTLGPQVIPALNRTADSLNAMARNAVVAANQMGSQGVLGQALRGSTTALETLEKVPARAVRSFTFLAAAASPALNRIALAVDDVSLKIQEKLQRAFESGALERAIDQAVATLAQLGGVIQNFAGGVANIFGGLTQDGGGLFDILEKISGAFNRLTASEEFQSILTELSLTASTLVDNILPVLLEAFVQLGPVIETLAPVIRDFINAIGPELTPVIEELGPVLVDLAQLLQEQLPLAIELTKAALALLVIALQALQVVMEEVVLPAARKVNEFLDSDFVNTIQTVSNVVTAGLPVLGQAFLTWASQVNTAMNGAITIVSNFVTQVKDTLTRGVSAGLDAVSRKFEELKQSIGQSLADLVNQMFQIGVNIMSGLASGLTAGIGRVLGIARDIANSIASTIDSALDIHSPSRRTKKSGKNVIEGLVVGMKSQQKLLEGTAKALAGITAKIFDTKAKGLSDAAQARLPTVTGRGTNVVNVFIDGKVVKQLINDQFRAALTKRDRTYAQGIRL